MIMNDLHCNLSPPWVVAHRGSSHTHPENTAASFDIAIQHDIAGIELDLQLSKDGVPIVYHDKTLARIHTGKKKISSLDLAELKTLDMGSWFDPRFTSQRILTLDEVLSMYGSKTRLLLEIKTREGKNGHDRHCELACKVAQKVTEAHLEDRVLILSFDLRVLNAAREQAPGLQYVLNLEQPPSITQDLQKEYEPLFALSVSIKTLTQPFVQALHEQNKPVLTFTCDSLKEAALAMDAGVDVIMTNRPAWLKSVINTRTQIKQIHNQGGES